MSDPVVSVWSPEPGLLSEGPRWHAERQELLWVDIVGRRLHRATVNAEGDLGGMDTVELDRDVGVVAPAAAAGYVAAAARSFLFIDESGTAVELASLTDVPSNVRFNDGACDERGRFWVGTMAYDKSPGVGVLYRLELDGSISTVLTGLTIPNGIGWSPDGAVMYFNDSGTGCMYEFDVDPSTGELGDRRTLVAFEQPGPAPDGLAVDDRGDIWVAVYGGWAVHRYSPEGKFLGAVELPAA
jgi:sugar lactone lactonase YvrE